ncbi:hypothetical protein C4K04_0153 [Pseudomonas chlororaphis]|uniref:Uncharacterized protein n=1 Tax=Pseudomonas chlororaphis TaxID=587753 RepID=A0A3G7TGU4_9PSED|nr:hypothetical protein C4K04_0153 [Pseudomonas chlororaphis]
MLAGPSVKEPLPWLYGFSITNKAKARQVFITEWSTLFKPRRRKTNTGESVEQAVFIILF